MKKASSDKLYEIAVILPQWYAFLYDIMEGILEVHSIRRHCHFRNFIHDDFTKEVAFPQGYTPDAILVSYDDGTHPAGWLTKLGLPIVNIYNSPKPLHPSVGPDVESIAHTVVEHFANLSYDSIGVLDTLNHATHSQFELSIKNECHKRNIDFWSTSVPDGIPAGSWSELENSSPELKAKLLGHKGKIGIYTHHDMRARLLADYCTHLGLNIPDQVGILGRFDSINARLSTPELSSIITPGKEIGSRAIQLLIKMVENQPIDHYHIRVKCLGVRVRESTVGSADPDMIALQARSIIRENACKAITVDELANLLPIARSSFEKRYKALTGISPAQEIRNIRVDTARKLLTATHKTIEEIARAVGFQDPRPFIVFFKREVGLTPGEFRKSNQQ